MRREPLLGKVNQEKGRGGLIRWGAQGPGEQGPEGMLPARRQQLKNA